MPKVTTGNVGKYCLLAVLAAGCNGGSGSGDNYGLSTGGSCTPVAANQEGVQAGAQASTKLSVANISDSEQFLEAPSTSSNSPNASSTEINLTKLHGHIPAVAKNFSDQGKLDEAQPMPVTIALQLNNEADLDQKLTTMYQSGSSNFHQFLTPAQFHAQYGPTDQQIATATAYLQSQGFSAITPTPDKMFLKATGSVSQISSAFHTELHQYTDTQAKTYYAPAYELQVPANTGIKAVVGLQNITHAHTHTSQPNTPPGETPKGANGSGPSNGLSPSDIRTAYNLPSGLTGAGQTMAVYELDGYTASDITAYEQKFSLPAVPLQNVLVDGATGTAGGGADEVTLDIELMLAVAPGASKVLVYEGPNDEQGIVDTYAKIANDNLAQDVGTSWGSAETSMSSSSIQAEAAIFKQMAAQGQSIYSAAGDSGSDDNGSSLSVDDPSSQPYVVGVGGTSVSIATGGAYQSETTWNDKSSGGGAGGGGISTIWTIPGWQANAATGKTLGSTTMRNVPDVSLEADPNNGYSIYYNGAWTIYGGTSCAAPIWAAFTALLNQQRQSSGTGLIGFPNALLYQIGSGGRYGSDFHDIADGSTNGYYPAVTGYDDATGLGSMNGSNLIQDLESEAAVPYNSTLNACK